MTGPCRVREESDADHLAAKQPPAGTPVIKAVATRMSPRWPGVTSMAMGVRARRRWRGSSWCGCRANGQSPAPARLGSFGSRRRCPDADLWPACQEWEGTLRTLIAELPELGRLGLTCSSMSQNSEGARESELSAVGVSLSPSPLKFFRSPCRPRSRTPGMWEPTSRRRTAGFAWRRRQLRLSPDRSNSTNWRDLPKRANPPSVLSARGPG
jgi:hypothetical protein